MRSIRRDKREADSLQTWLIADHKEQSEMDLARAQRLWRWGVQKGISDGRKALASAGGHDDGVRGTAICSPAIGPGLARSVGDCGVLLGCMV